MFYLNMVDYTVFFPVLSTLTWDTLLTPSWLKILVSAPVPLELILTGFDWVGAGPWGVWVLGRGLTKIFLGQMLNNFFFKNTSFIVFFNKVDLFKEKLKTAPITIAYKDYLGKQDYDEAL